MGRWDECQSGGLFERFQSSPLSLVSGTIRHDEEISLEAEWTVTGDSFVANNVQDYLPCARYVSRHEEEFVDDQRRRLHHN